MRMAKVTWLDAHSFDPWHDTPEKFIEYLVESVGFINEAVTNSDSGVVLVGSVEGEFESVCFGTLHIPVGCIKKIEFLESIKD